MITAIGIFAGEPAGEPPIELAFDPTMLASNSVLTNSNKTLSANGSGGGSLFGGARGNIASSGKRYFEFYVTEDFVNVYPTVGVCQSFDGSAGELPSGASWLNAVGLRMNGTYAHEPTSTSYSAWGGGIFSTGDTVGVAFDSDAGLVWFSKNGTFVGDPVAGTGGITTSSTGPLYPAASAGYVTTGKVTLVGTGTVYGPPTGYSLIEG